MSNRRLVIKTMVYRILSTLVSVIIFAFVADIHLALILGITTGIIKTGLYFVYDKLWGKFK